MQKVKNILVPIDLLQSSATVIKKAIDLAVMFDAVLHVIHITTANTVPIIQKSGYIDPRHNSEEIKIQQLQVFKEQLDDLNIKNNVSLIKGDVSVSIKKVAKEFEADVIVLGLHKHDSFYNLIVGSIAKELIKNAQRPLFMVPVREEEKRVNISFLQ